MDLIQLGDGKPTEHELRSLQSFISKRELRLFHFTNQMNITGIAEHGLVPRTHPKFESLVPEPKITDTTRAVHGGTCFSVGWPNFAMMAYKKLNLLKEGETFVILEIDSRILLEKNWFAFPTNSSGKEIARAVRARPGQFSASGALQIMFEDCAKTTKGTWVNRSELGLTEDLPTDPQAEIVFEETIERHWINTVFVEMQHQLNQVETLRPDLLSKLEFVYAPEMFKPRVDNAFWRNGVRLTYPIVVPSPVND